MTKTLEERIANLPTRDFRDSRYYDPDEIFDELRQATSILAELQEENKKLKKIVLDLRYTQARDYIVNTVIDAGLSKSKGNFNEKTEELVEQLNNEKQ